MFFDVEDEARDQVEVGPIERDSERWHLIQQAKKHRTFRVQPRLLPSRFAHPCLLSNHLAPFALAEPARAVLPVLRDGEGWRLVTGEELAVTPRARDHFRDVVRESDYGSLEQFQARRLDFRSKLSGQRWPGDAWGVVYGSGGGIPAAAYARIGENPAILDQTLYGFRVEDEALYFCGVVNSLALRERIACFIPEGKFAGRHLHTLPQDETPRYDRNNPAHAEVVAATRALVDELNSRRHDPDGRPTVYDGD